MLLGFTTSRDSNTLQQHSVLFTYVAAV